GARSTVSLRSLVALRARHGGMAPTVALPCGPVPSVAAAEARQLSELSNKAGDKLAAQRYDLMAKHLEAADKPPPELSAHAQMQKAHKEVQQLESRAKKDLQRLTKAEEHVAELELSLRETRDRLKLADEEYKSALVTLQAAKVEPQMQTATLKLGDLVSGEFSIESSINCDDLLEEFAAGEVELEEADRKEFESRRAALVSGVQELAQKLFQQVADNGKEARSAHEAVLKRAQQFPDGGGGARGLGGGARPPAAGSKREQRLEKQTQELTKRVEQFFAGGAKASAQQGGEGDRPAAAAKDEKETGDPLRAEAAQLELAIAARKSEPASAAKAMLEENLRGVRAQIEARKPDLTQRNNVGDRLNRCKARLVKVGSEVTDITKRLDELQKEKTELVQKRDTIQKECAELQRQLVTTVPLGESPADDTFGVPQELLDGNAEIKAMVDSEPFKEFAKLFRPHVTPGAQRPATPVAPPEGSAGAAHVDQPVPADEFDDMFVDEQAADDFWEKHKGDKRAILEAIMGANTKIDYFLAPTAFSKLVQEMAAWPRSLHGLDGQEVEWSQFDSTGLYQTSQAAEQLQLALLPIFVPRLAHECYSDCMNLEVIDALAQPERGIGQANWRADPEAKKAIELHAAFAAAAKSCLDCAEGFTLCAALQSPALSLKNRRRRISLVTSGSKAVDLLSSAKEVIGVLCRGARALHAAVARTLQCKLAMDKIGMVSSSSFVAHKLEESLGSLVGTACTRATNLGSDFTAGRHARLQVTRRLQAIYFLIGVSFVAKLETLFFTVSMNALLCSRNAMQFFLCGFKRKPAKLALTL
ncbi:unnamed protein product, partial [Prorocentrum cordatum]